MFNHAFLPVTEIDSVTSPEGERRYTLPDGTVYPSVTTIIGRLDPDPQWKADWIERVGEDEATKITKRALRQGSEVHKLAEKYIGNDPHWARGSMPIHKAMFMQIRPLLDANLGDVYGIEFPVWSHSLKTAGRIDLPAVWGGIPSIVDFKTASWPKEESDIGGYFLQTGAYATMFEEITGISLPQVVILMMVRHSEVIVFTRKTADIRDDINRVFRDREKI
jgi:hypothetical protein